MICHFASLPTFFISLFFAALLPSYFPFFSAALLPSMIASLLPTLLLFVDLTSFPPSSLKSFLFCFFSSFFLHSSLPPSHLLFFHCSHLQSLLDSFLSISLSHQTDISFPPHLLSQPHYNGALDSPA